MPIEQSEGPPMERPHNGLLALTYGTRRDLSRPDVLDEELGHASLNPMELTRRVTALAKQADIIANVVQGQPTREDYDGLMAENAAMREKIGALETQYGRLEALLNKFLPRAA